MKSQAIFKSIEKLSDSRILDIYLRVLKKEERTTGALETSARRAPDGNQCYFILIQKEKRKKGKAQGKAQDSKQKKKKKRKRRKKKHLAGFEPPALRPEDLSFSAPHTIRPSAHGRVTSFPAYTNLTDK